MPKKIEKSPAPGTAIDPDHYKQHPSGVECIEIIAHMPASVAMAVKYLWRVDGKGDPIEQLEKAKRFIDFEINLRKTGNPLGKVRRD